MQPQFSHFQFGLCFCRIKSIEGAFYSVCSLFKRQTPHNSENANVKEFFFLFGSNNRLVGVLMYLNVIEIYQLGKFAEVQLRPKATISHNLAKYHAFCCHV